MTEDNTFNFDDYIDNEQVQNLFMQNRLFRRSMLRYQCALMEIETKCKILDAEFSLQHDRNPIESIKTRLKHPLSIYNKMKARDLPMNLEIMENNILDIAGIRIICSFEEDVYYLRDCLAGQDDVEVLIEKDYIKNPKPNGYRSLHLTISIPVFFAEYVDHVPVEIQFRTMAMDFWASLEHTIRYKKDISENAYISEQLLACARSSQVWDQKMAHLMHLLTDEEVEEEKGASYDAEESGPKQTP